MRKRVITFSSFGEIDDEQFQQLSQHVSQYVDSKTFKNEVVKSSRRVGTQGERLVKSMTPVKSGTLRRNWHVRGPMITSTLIAIEIYNNMEYASFVEHGHRQAPGRYVPAIHKRLKVSWVPGTHMLTKTLFYLDEQIPMLLTPTLSQLGKLFE
ncbi:HK97 gp10 family phage protein [Bombilactobacillus bombi]|uniref:HK97 gp10 family phage protein n=1 Tax=Bombilactobacillus bombi TaxID=1303590 RepID=A0A417ZEN0_9LACO|nr:HK97 gp10 family phage protein [Bombilactobacillus bombi]RHW49718.1 HK97 gp10 family phage protein [Bombilactobacillus bombi]